MSELPFAYCTSRLKNLSIAAQSLTHLAGTTGWGCSKRIDAFKKFLQLDREQGTQPTLLSICTIMRSAFTCPTRLDLNDI